MRQGEQRQCKQRQGGNAVEAGYADAGPDRAGEFKTEDNTFGSM
jgi:hypothetical protein